jgi:L-malate glycosyltransferase
VKVVHIIGGGDIGGAKVHVLSLVKELGKHIDVKIISLRPGSFADDAKAMGIDIEVVKTGNILIDIKKVTDIIRNEGFQIIHSHGAKANMFSLLSGSFLKLPTVSTVHSDYRLDYIHNRLKNITIAPANTYALRKINYHIGVSEKFRNMLIERNFNPQNIFTVYNGMNFEIPVTTISREEFSSKYGLNLKNEDILVGIAARLYPVKRIDTLIDAAKKVVPSNPSVKFIIGGDGEDRKYLEHKVSSLGLSSNVIFLGWLDNPYELMSNIDISILTSISESFPYSILEGARFKKATVSTNVGGIPDLIEHNINGYLFNPGDHNTLSMYILELSTNPVKRKEMGEKIYEKAKSKFSLKNMCSTQLSIYNCILRLYKTISRTCNIYDAIISGYYGFQNIGDDAMLKAIINNLRKYKPEIRIAVLSNNPPETKKLYGVNSISRANPLSIIKIMKQARLFIYGGGNLIQDNTSSRSLLYYLSTIWFAKKLGLKVMIYANGIGPLNRKINIFFTKKIINRVEIITVREMLSLSELKKLEIEKPGVLVTADPALTTEASTDKEASIIMSNEHVPLNSTYVGFSVRKMPGHENRKYEKYEDVIAKTADYLADTYSVTPVFIPMQSNDIDIINNVLLKMTTNGFVIKGKYTASNITAVIRKMDILIGMRLHALIFAASYCVPMVGLVYDPKIEGFLQYINQSAAVAGNIMDVDFNRLRNITDYVWHNRDKIRIDLKKNVSALRQKALENARIAVGLINNDF